MYHFGKTSLERLETCHPDLQKVMHEAIKITDFTVLCGHRGEESQNQAYREGRSKLVFPKSKHNAFPALAIDIAPWPIAWDDREQFYYTAGIIIGVARSLEIPLRHGGDWDSDGRITDNTWDDLPHFELYERRQNV